MADVNNCTFTGRLTRDPEKRTSPTGTAILAFDIANNIGWNDNKKVMYISCSVWGKTGENIAQYLHKGTLVGVSGEIELQKWVSKQDNTPQSKMALNTKSCIILKQPGEAQPQQDAVPYEPEEDKDIQF